MRGAVHEFQRDVIQEVVVITIEVGLQLLRYEGFSMILQRSGEIDNEPKANR